MSVFGVDFGNLNSTVAITRYGGVDIVTNEVSKRETTTIVSFLQDERFIGEQGLDRFVRNAQNTVFLVKRFIGMRMDDPQLEEEMKFLTCNVEGDADGRLMFSVLYCDEVQRFYPEQILAMMLQRLRSYVNEAATTDARFKADVKDFVITVPSYYTAEQRRLMYQAAETAGLHCMSLVNETTASAVDYGIFRGTTLNDTEAEAQIVGILDIGYGATDFSICKFWKGNCKVIGRTFDRNNGTRNCDYLLYLHLVEEVKAKYKVDVRDNKRARLRLLQACERLKYLLSANQSAPFNVENVMDIDINIPSFERATMETLCASVVDRVKAVMERGFAQAGFTPDQLHSIEMIGGGCRIPMLKRMVEELIGRPPNFTLNASEATARGCAIIAAMLSPKFQVREFRISELPTYPILLGYHADNPRSPSSIAFLPEVNKVVKLLGCNDSYPKKLDVRVPCTGTWKLYAFYDPENELVKDAVIPANYIIGEWEIGAPGGSAVKGKVQEVRVRINIKPDGLLVVERADAIDVVEVAAAPEAESAPANEEAEAEVAGKENEEEKKPAKKSVESLISVSVKPNVEVLGHSSDAILRFRKTEAEMHERDSRIIRTREKKNELESYILDFRPRIATGGELAEYVTPDVATQFIKNCDEDEQWLYEDGEAASYEEYEKRVNALRSVGGPAYYKHKARGDIDFEMKNFTASLTAAKETALKTIGTTEHLTEEELRAAAATADEAIAWANQSVATMHASPKTAELPISVADLKSKQEAVIQGIQRVVKRPAPPPPKAEKPAAAAAENEEKAPPAEEASAPQPETAAEEDSAKQ